MENLAKLINNKNNYDTMYVYLD